MPLEARHGIDLKRPGTEEAVHSQPGPAEQECVQYYGGMTSSQEQGRRMSRVLSIVRPGWGGIPTHPEESRITLFSSVRPAPQRNLVSQPKIQLTP